MSQANSVSGPTARLYAERLTVVRTTVSNRERTSAALVAGVIVLTCVVVVLFTIWLTLFPNQSSWNRSIPMGFGDVEFDDPADQLPDGIVDDWQPPGIEQFDVPEPQLMNALQAVTDSVTTSKADIAKIDGNSMLNGYSNGDGDFRKIGLFQEVDILPEWERWKLEYSAASMGEYVKQLGHLGITFGAVSQLSNQIVFVDKMHDEPVKKTGSRTSNEAKRLYFRMTNSRLRTWEKAYLKGQEVELENRLIVQFIPEETRLKLAAMELEAIKAAGKSIDEVKQVRFAVRAKDEGFEFYVVDDGIKYRPKPTPSEGKLKTLKELKSGASNESKSGSSSSKKSGVDSKK